MIACAPMNPPAGSNPSGASALARLARAAALSAAALLALGLAWELWLAPLRPGGSLLALKVVPAALALRGLVARRVRTYQWWSMAVLVYVCEAAVRALSDTGLSAQLAMLEGALSVASFAATLAFGRAAR